MTIVHEAGECKFVAYAGKDQRMGEIVYAPRGDKQIAATHTLVENTHRGKGVAGELLHALVAWAEAEELTIVPICSYVVNAFAREPERYRKVNL